VSWYRSVCNPCKCSESTYSPMTKYSRDFYYWATQLVSQYSKAITRVQCPCTCPFLNWKTFDLNTLHLRVMTTARWGLKVSMRSRGQIAKLTAQGICIAPPTGRPRAYTSQSNRQSVSQLLGSGLITNVTCLHAYCCTFVCVFPV